MAHAYNGSGARHAGKRLFHTDISGKISYAAIGITPCTIVRLNHNWIVLRYFEYIKTSECLHFLFHDLHVSMKFPNRNANVQCIENRRYVDFYGADQIVPGEHECV